MKELVYGTNEYVAVKNEAMALFGVVPTEYFDVKSAIRNRIDYLKKNLRDTGFKGYVLGISGGVDSTTAGRLAQLACEELRAEGYDAQFIAMRLPANVQRDEADAQAAVKFINADKMLTVNVGPAAKLICDQSLQEMEKNGLKLSDKANDFNLGNAVCRTRMLAQYHVGASFHAMILGTDHSTEGICGFYTKWADGACDLLVLNGLNKTQVRLVAKELGAPQFLYAKVAFADLEELSPQLPDEVALGFSYDVLDAFLEGKNIDKETEYKIVKQFYITQHKRKPIPGFTI